MVNLLADFVVRFNSGVKKHSQCIYVPYSHTVIKVVRLMFKYNCISSFSIDAAHNKALLQIKIVPLYMDSVSVIKGLELVSRPGLRIYWSASELSMNFFRNNFQGFFVLSTPNGLCSSNELISAFMLKQPISGEILLKVNF